MIRLLVGGAVLVTALSACQMSHEQLQDKIQQIPGVERADVDGAGGDIVLEDGISVEDAVETMEAARDEMVENHKRGLDATFAVYVLLEPDDGDRLPRQVYGEWSRGASTEAKFEQQATFLASFASGTSLIDGPIDLAYIQFGVHGDSELPVWVSVHDVGKSDPADVQALVADLERRWVDSGGSLDGLYISAP